MTTNTFLVAIRGLLETNDLQTGAILVHERDRTRVEYLYLRASADTARFGRLHSVRDDRQVSVGVQGAIGMDWSGRARRGRLRIALTSPDMRLSGHSSIQALRLRAFTVRAFIWPAALWSARDLAVLRCPFECCGPVRRDMIKVGVRAVDLVHEVVGPIVPDLEHARLALADRNRATRLGSSSCSRFRGIHGTVALPMMPVALH